ncbi:YbaB/EbfC family nucleoid-associated protein [Nocardia sp. NPDC019395]|uniref:YbaB/EbfC family nucleoid-associated protein n=1 Tax=Nocardia sp. NPDC019395 TaxID=3154686 RepID=UPI0034045230
MTADLDRAIEGFAQMAADAERRSERFAELQERMTSLTATESGAGGRVSVTVDSSGIPTAIDLAPSAREMDSRALSARSCLVCGGHKENFGRVLPDWSRM